jgi:DNA-binding XRE family transcriptional regulator
VNASILLGYTEAIRRRPHGFGRWSRPEGTDAPRLSTAPVPLASPSDPDLDLALARRCWWAHVVEGRSALTHTSQCPHRWWCTVGPWAGARRTPVEVSKMAKKVPNPIDKHVGSRVRMRRMMLGMSQEKLGDALGITFQQVQKNEKGTNRIGASRLQHNGRLSW